MRLALCTLLLLTPLSLAQDPAQPIQLRPTVQPAAAQTPGQTGATTLRGEAKLRYIGRRLGLNAEQQKTFDTYLDTYRVTIEAEAQNQTAYLTQLKELITQQTEAEKAGNTAEAERIRQEINLTRPGARAEQEFFLNLEKVLSPPQKETLALLRMHAERPGGLELSSLYVLKTAKALSLTPEQARQIDRLESEARAAMNPTGAQPPPRESVRDKLISEIRAVLNAEQQQQFDLRIDILRSKPGDEGASAAQPAPAPAPKPTP